MLLEQQKSSSMDVLTMSALTLEEESSSAEDVLPKMSSSKVGLICSRWRVFLCSPEGTCLPVPACAGVLLCLRRSGGGGSFGAANLT